MVMDVFFNSSRKAVFTFLFLVPLNSTVTLSSDKWAAQPPGLGEDLVGDLAESTLDKTFNLGKKTIRLELLVSTVVCLETAANLPQSPEIKPEPRQVRSATVVKNRPPPLEKKPAVPPKPSKMLLANPARKTTSDVATNILKPKTSALKRPKIKSPFLPSPGRLLIPVKKVGGLKEVSPVAPKNPLQSELRRKNSVSKDSAGAERRNVVPVLTGSASKPSKDGGRKSLVSASGERDKLSGGQKLNNNQSEVPNKNKVLTAPQVKPRIAPAKSPMSLHTVEARTEGVGSSSSLQRRRKSVGDVMKGSVLTSRKPTTTTPSQPRSVTRLASQPRRSLSNSSLKRAVAAGGPLTLTSQRTSAASSLTPPLQSTNIRNSVGLQSKKARENNPALNKSQSASRMKSARSDLVRSGSSSGEVKKPARMEERKLQKTVLEANKKKFDVLALVATTVIEENDKLEKIIKKNKLQLADTEGELEVCKVSLIVFLQHNNMLDLIILGEAEE